MRKFILPFRYKKCPACKHMIYQNLVKNIIINKNNYIYKNKINIKIK